VSGIVTDEQKISGYITTQLSKEELGDTAEEAREMCLAKAEEINQDSPNLVNIVCNVSFYPAAFGSTPVQGTISSDHVANPCIIFSHCTSKYPSIVDANSNGLDGVETLFTDSSLFCERSNWKTKLEFDEKTSTFPSIPAEQMNLTFRNIPIGSTDFNNTTTNLYDSFNSNKNLTGSQRTADVLDEIEGYDDTDTVFMVTREKLEGAGDINEIRAKCLERAATDFDNVCGINFYPDAFGERNKISETNDLWPCQIFVECDSNPGYDDRAEEEGTEALFTRPSLLCSNCTQPPFDKC
jgi:hypothetical protein